MDFLKEATVSAPLSRQFFAVRNSDADFDRQIDNHYHVEMIAHDSHQLVAIQSASYQLQRDAAIANMRGLAEVASRQETTNNILASVADGIERVNEGMYQLNRTADDTLDAVYEQTEVLQAGFQQIAEGILKQQATLNEIADVLRSPYETKVLELLQEADKALKQAMQTTGRERNDEFKDASRLLGDVLANPIGSRNYVAWFQVGWLKWKFERKFDEAEEAFYQASRLSASKADLYHANGLRHMAYMQYLQGKHQDAYNSIHKAMNVLPDDHDIRYDAARYAAKVGKEAESLELLDSCIDQRPQTIVTMFSEKDFL